MGIHVKSSDDAGKKQNPSLWKAINQRSSGNQLEPDGLWTWSRINPLEDIQTGLFQNSNKKQIMGTAEYAWHIAMRLPNETLVEIANHAWRKIYLPMGLLILISGAFTAGVACQNSKAQCGIG